MLKGLLPEDDRTYFGITVLPLVFINLTPDHVIIHRIIPISAEKSKVICEWLFDPEEMAKPDFDQKMPWNYFTALIYKTLKRVSGVKKI